MSKSAVILRWHHWLGLVSGVLLFVVSLSGAVLVFHKEIDDITFPAEAIFSHELTTLEYDRAFNNIQSLYPYHKLRLYLQQKHTNKALVFEARGEQSQRLVYVHPQSGKVLLDVDRFSTPSRWLLKLHYTLFAGVVGNILLAILGLSLIASLLTGLFIYRKRLIPVLLFREKLSLKSKRSFYSGTHRYVGVWSLLFNILLAVTGIWIQIAVIGANLGNASSTLTPKPNPAVSLLKIMEAIKEQQNIFTSAFIIFPADAQSPILIYGKSSQTNPLLPEYADVLKLDIDNYKPSALVLNHELPLAKRLYSWVISLHFGGFGGLPIKLAYFIFGLAPAWLSISGWVLYRKRDKAKKKNKILEPALKV